VPLPLIPGDVLLITAGILIANDAISPGPLFLPRSWPCWREHSPAIYGAGPLARKDSPSWPSDCMSRARLIARPVACKPPAP
jgi:hypothetical protein